MKEEIEHQVESNDEAMEYSDRSINMDYEDASRMRNGAYSVMPDDIWQVRFMETIPTSEKEFDGEITKDNVLANVGGSKPDLTEVRFVTQTINLVKNIFIVEKDMPLIDNQGQFMYDKHGRMLLQKRSLPDPDFRPIWEALEIDIKSALTTSRALGDQRESVLMRTMNLNKKIGKQKADQMNGTLGGGTR